MCRNFLLYGHTILSLTGEGRRRRRLEIKWRSKLPYPAHDSTSKPFWRMQSILRRYVLTTQFQGHLITFTRQEKRQACIKGDTMGRRSVSVFQVGSIRFSVYWSVFFQVGSVLVVGFPNIAISVRYFTLCQSAQRADPKILLPNQSADIDRRSSSLTAYSRIWQKLKSALRTSADLTGGSGWQ